MVSPLCDNCLSRINFAKRAAAMAAMAAVMAATDGTCLAFARARTKREEGNVTGIFIPSRSSQLSLFRRLRHRRDVQLSAALILISPSFRSFSFVSPTRPLTFAVIPRRCWIFEVQPSS